MLLPAIARISFYIMTIEAVRKLPRAKNCGSWKRFGRNSAGQTLNSIHRPGTERNWLKLNAVLHEGKEQILDWETAKKKLRKRFE